MLGRQLDDERQADVWRSNQLGWWHLGAKNVILPLLLAITEPMEPHIHSLGAFLFDGVIGDTTGCVVVGLQRGCGCPSSSNAVGMGQRAWALRNKAPNLALVALGKLGTCFDIKYGLGHCQVVLGQWKWEVQLVVSSGRSSQQHGSGPWGQ